MWVRAPIAYLRPPSGRGERKYAGNPTAGRGSGTAMGCLEAEVQLPVRRVRRGEAEAEAMGPGYRAAADMLNGMRELFRCRDTRSLGAAELVDR
jgi:alkylated DNA nucleotide flippase Atl1